MATSNFVTSSLPQSQENTGVWGWVRRNVLGRFGRFNRNFTSMFPINAKMFLIDTSPGELMSVAMEVPHLNTVLSTGARIFSMMEIKHVDKDGNDIKDSAVLKFLQRPNPLQTQRQYLYELYIVHGVYNKTFQNMVRGLSYELPQAMWILPSGWMKVNTTGRIYRQTKLEDIIVDFRMLNEDMPFTVKDVIYTAEGVGSNLLNPMSRIQTLQIPLSNIMACLKSRNTITTTRGATGIIASENTSDGEGAIPLDDKEAEKMRKKYKEQYSVDSDGGHVMFTHNAVKWIPMSFKADELQLVEYTEDDFAQVIASFMHDRDIYPTTKGATFENKREGMKQTIQNGIQPLADMFVEQWTARLIDPNSGEKLIASFAHHPAMKVDQLTAAQGMFYKTRALSLALHDGVIDHETYADEDDLEMTGDAKIIVSSPQNNSNDNENEPKNPPKK